MIGTREQIEVELPNENETMTLKEFLEKQREMELEAAAALPFKFDKCSAEFGPLRQNLHICHNCPNLKGKNEHPVAFCYSCAVTCHNFDPENGQDCDKGEAEDVFDAYGEEPSQGSQHRHSIEEIWARRNFICDCPSTGKCKLLSSIPESFASHTNSYHRPHNFYGRYCFCDGKGWAAGDRTMYQCEVCEDWYHDTCVAKDHQNRESDEEVEIPAEDSFSDFICKGCVNRHHRTFFSKLTLNNTIFTVPAASSIKTSSAPLFLVKGWREVLRLQFDGMNSMIPAELNHLLRDEEAVYEPEIDNEAKESLYDRKDNNSRQQFYSFSNLLSFLFSFLFSRLEGFGTMRPEGSSNSGNKND